MTSSHLIPKHPTSYLRDNIPGFISIVQVGSDYLLAWIPEASIQGTPDMEAFVLVELSAQGSRELSPLPRLDTHSTPLTYLHLTPDATLVTLPPPSSAHAFSIPIRHLYSLIIQPPTLTSWFGSITFNLYDVDSEGETRTLPPLYFHDEESRSTVLDQDRRAQSLGIASAASRSSSAATLPPSWGGEALLSVLKQHANLVRSKLEPRLFLVNPSKADRQVHETLLFDDEAVPPGARIGVRGTVKPPSRTGGERERGAEGNRARTSILHQSFDNAAPSSSAASSNATDFPNEVPNASVGDFTFSVLNSFSRITRGRVLIPLFLSVS